MRRREFIAGVVAATAFPSAVHGQRIEPVRRVDILVAEANEDDPYYERRLAVLRDGLRDLGWIEGQNLSLNIHRSAPRAADIRKHVDEILAGRPDVIVTSGGTTAGPILQATKIVPVVFMSAIDPVGAGFVESLAHPGGKATGYMQFDYSLSAKWLELLKQAVPSTVRVGVIRDPTVPSGIGQFAVIQSVAGSVGVDIIPINTRNAGEIESGIAKLARSPNGGLIATSGAAVNGHRDLIVQLAARYRLPAVYAGRMFVDHGGMIAYGADVVTNYRRAAGYVDRILKGEKPADLPVQAPDKYDLVINLKAAKALGLELPANVVSRADEVIE